MGLAIDDLLRRIGIDKVRVQFLHECVTNATARKRGGCDLTFHTRETSPDAFVNDDPATIGIVVWVPYREFRQAQESWKAEAEVIRLSARPGEKMPHD